MKQLKGLSRVFTFTFRQQTRSSGYRSLTAAVAALCLLIPAIVLGIMAMRAGSKPDTPVYIPEDSWEIPVCHAQAVYVIDETEKPITDWSFLQRLHPDSWGEMDYTAEAGSSTILLKLTKAGGAYEAHVSLTGDTVLAEEDLFAYESFLWENFPAILQVKSGLTPDQLAAIHAPIEAGRIELPEDTDPQAGSKAVLGLILPYLCVMVMYFLVLFYGQGVANSVILEKTSKLMDFFLVTVEPAAMVLGKVLAMATAALLQLCLWLAALAGGFGVGAWLCRTLAPGEAFGILAFFDSLRLFEGMFSLGGVVLAVAIMLGGFLIYCALAGVGGALAGKTEDLSSTNVLFSMTLVVSFLICLLGGSGDEMISAATWLNFVPFTAILVTPARVLLGDVSLGLGAVSLLIVLITATLLCLAAGKVYRMMSLYKGNPPSLQKLLTMLKEDK